MKKRFLTLIVGGSMMAATSLVVFVESPAFADEAISQSIDIDIQYRYRRKGSNEFKMLTDGGTLYSGDSYKIVFTPTETTYVYIFQKGSSGNLYRLFPMKGFNGVIVNNFNPAQAGTTYFIPAPNKSFFLDEQIGEEQIYIIAARQADRMLDQQYQQVLIARRGYNPVTIQRSQAALERAINMRDPSGITTDSVVVQQTKADDEEEQPFAMLWQRLEICEGCVNTLTFRHR